MRTIGLLHQKLAPFLNEVHTKRIRTVWVAVEGLLRGGRIAPAQLARATRSRASPKSRIKRIWRLLRNWQLHAELTVWFAGISFGLIGRTRRALILVDWTEIGRDHEALVAAVPIQGRAVPIYVEVHPKRLLGNQRVERNFLLTLKRKIVPTSCTPIIVADAGYQNPWFASVRELGWDFIGRLNTNVLITETAIDSKRPPKRHEWTPAEHISASATNEPRDLGWHWVAFNNPLKGRLVLFGGPKKNRTGSGKPNRKGVHAGSAAFKKAKNRNRDPWILITSLRDDTATSVVGHYATRMRIEEAFRDAKSHRLGWSFEDVSLKDPQRIRVLLLIATLGMLAVTLVGLAAETAGYHRRYQANTIRHRRVLSLFYLGRQILADSHPPPIGLTKLRQALNQLRQVIQLPADVC